MRQNQTIILKVHQKERQGHVGKFSKFCLLQQLFAFKKFCMETRLPYISNSANATAFIKAILKSSCRVLLDTCNFTARVFAKGR